MTKLVYLSLGSNLGDRARYIEQALGLLGGSDFRVLRQSALYETEPRDVAGQPWFLNLVAEVETTLFPRQLLARIKRVEARLGRKRLVVRGPRTIDIDILLFGDFVVETADLVIPHPRMSERRFVLEPLAELAPEMRHPVMRKRICQMLAGVSSQKVNKLHPPATG